MGITKEEAIMALVRTVRACWNAVPINGWQQELLNDQIKRIVEKIETDQNIIEELDREYFTAHYSADLLPMIPKDVSEWLTWCKRKHHSLKDGLDGETRVSVDVFALAWVLGVWRVEETGEIVKSEAEK